MSTSQTELTVFYDGFCPLCVKEMAQLKRFDTSNKLETVDIQQPDFVEQYPNIDPVQADKILHVLTRNGEILLGLDATSAAWQLVNKHPWVHALRWPLIKPIADRVYLWFARNRYQISYWLTGQKRCDRCVK